jgi:hypothetical protein
MMKRTNFRIGRGFAIVAGSAALMAMLGTSSFAADPAAPSGQQVELTFDLSKCQEQGPNLYKCPAIDKPLCTKEFQQPNVQCIRIGKKGNVFVFTPGSGMD